MSARELLLLGSGAFCAGLVEDRLDGGIIMRVVGVLGRAALATAFRIFVLSATLRSTRARCSEAAARARAVAALDL